MRYFLFLSILFTFFGFASCAQQTGSKATQHLTTDEVKKVLQQNLDLVILDVRTPEEYNQGHLQGAQNLDFYAPDFESKFTALDSTQTYLLYCASGNRSGKAATMMERNNYGKVYNSKAGFSELKSAGVPVK